MQIFLTTLENPSTCHDKYFKQLLDTPIHPRVCCQWLCFNIYKYINPRFKNILYMFHLKKKIPLLCKSCYSFFNKNKTPKFLIPKYYIEQWHRFCKKN
jgi:hypothetical protein